MSDISHEELVSAGEERAAEYARTAPRCVWCKTKPGWEVLDGFCTACRLRWVAEGKPPLIGRE